MMEVPVNFAIWSTHQRPSGWRRWWRRPGSHWLLVAALGSLLTWLGWLIVIVVSIRIAS